MNLSEKFNHKEFSDWIEKFIPDFSSNLRQVDVPNGLSGVKSITTLGEASLGLRVFVIETEKDPSSRKIGLAKESFNLIKNYGTPNALIAYYSKESSKWRLSLLTSTPDWSEGKIITKLSSPKRQSYVLGPQSKVNTPNRFLLKQVAVTDINDLKSRFSLEVVNKEFYKEISESFIKLVGGTVGTGGSQKKYEPILKLPFVTDRSQTNIEFAVRLIGRIIFCWFLREKKSADGTSLMPKELVSLEAIEKHSDYYHQVLEPIFFEVLNQQVKSRKDPFFDKPYSLIPYLNGGLFSPHDDDFYKRSNGDFQSQFHNTLVIPDDWFLQLFKTLETYNFTIDENTSFDEELSIDPEMLGRIFENLLAEINPETGESARKSTGSYYTPRVIVDYMVDESLLLYLTHQTGIKESKLRAIISYDLTDDTEHPLDQSEKEKAIDALEKIKILDPACGSGAFPIGALQKMVFILQQIDPDGHLWFKKQIQHTSPEIRRVLEREFTHKNFDYIRKLGVIRENIYGIDIQPIATEISRLRCFLTIVVDQRIDDSLDNRGIEPLPNLDFKFVTANSLIGLPSTGKQVQFGLFEDSEGISELKEIRDLFFNASGSEREVLKLQFVQSQNKMFQRLISEGRRGHADLTTKLTSWNPFSHKASSWFDPEWMFGIKQGFDIVIANPPYIKERDNKHIFEEVNNSDFGQKYHQGKMDFWFYFLHKAIDLVRDRGTVSYITSRYWLNSTGARKLIQRLKNQMSFIHLIDIGKLKVFDEVAGQHMVAVYSKQKHTEEFIYKLLENNITDISSSKSTENLTIGILKNSQIYSNDDQIELDFDELTYGNCEQLGTIYDVSQGIVQNPDKVSKKTSEVYDLTQGEGVFVLSSDELLQLKLTKAEEFFVRDFFDENDIRKYSGHIRASKYLLYITKDNCPDISVYPNLYQHLMRYKKIMDARRETKNGSNKWFHLHWPREERFFSKPKVVISGMFATPNAEYIEKSAYFGLSSNIIIEKNENYKLKYVLAIINSTFGKYWFYKHGKKRGVGVDIGVSKLRIFPIKNASVNQQEGIEEVINLIISSIDQGSDNAKLIAYGKRLDQLIYDLYGFTVKEIDIIENHKS